MNAGIKTGSLPLSIKVIMKLSQNELINMKRKKTIKGQYILLDKEISLVSKNSQSNL